MDKQKIFNDYIKSILMTFPVDFEKILEDNMDSKDFNDLSKRENFFLDYEDTFLLGIKDYFVPYLLAKKEFIEDNEDPSMMDLAKILKDNLIVGLAKILVKSHHYTKEQIIEGYQEFTKEFDINLKIEDQLDKFKDGKFEDYDLTILIALVIGLFETTSQDSVVNAIINELP